MTTFFAFLFNIAFGIVRNLVAGWCLACYWSWFIVTAFNAPQLDYLHAVGVTMTVGFAAMAAGIATKADTTEARSVNEAFAKAIGSHLGHIIIFPIVTGIAYVWHLFIG